MVEKAHMKTVKERCSAAKPAHMKTVVGRCSAVKPAHMKSPRWGEGLGFHRRLGRLERIQI